MRLASVRLQVDAAPPSPAAARLLAAGAQLVADHFAAPGRVPGVGFVPGAFAAVHGALRAVRREHPEARRFLEWGSGLGVVTGLAASLGFEAHGIEIDGALVAASRRLLAEHAPRAVIVAGSFVPDVAAHRDRIAAGEGQTVLHGAAAYDDMDLALDDFDVVYAYPWPGETAAYRELFRREADFGALLLLYDATEGVRAWRKVAGGRGRGAGDGDKE